MNDIAMRQKNCKPNWPLKWKKKLLTSKNIESKQVWDGCKSLLKMSKLFYLDFGVQDAIQCENYLFDHRLPFCRNGDEQMEIKFRHRHNKKMRRK